jgi:1,4-alpha-glucan branching enzyme
MKKTKTSKTVKATEKIMGNTTGTIHAAKESSTAEKVNASESPEKQQAESLGIRKEYTNLHKICRTTFRLPGGAALKARKVTIVGDFNNWDKEATPMKKLKNGDFTITLGLAPGREYRFRYLIDGKKWENDWCADKYVKNPYGVEDSVVCT